MSTEGAELSLLGILNGSPSGPQSQLPEAPHWEDFTGTGSLYWAYRNLSTVFPMLILHSKTICVWGHQELVTQESDDILEGKATA